jgi:hypothetical protein
MRGFAAGSHVGNGQCNEGIYLEALSRQKFHIIEGLRWLSLAMWDCR